MFVIVDDETAQVTGYLFVASSPAEPREAADVGQRDSLQGDETDALASQIYLPADEDPVDEIDALASRITFGHDPKMMRALRRVAMNDEAGDLDNWADDLDMWDGELEAGDELWHGS